jgi:hypothetical protein
MDPTMTKTQNNLFVAATNASKEMLDLSQLLFSAKSKDDFNDKLEKIAASIRALKLK